jgi:hypothetical protein
MADVDQTGGEVLTDDTSLEVGGDADFHSYTGDDGKIQSWKTPDELNDFIKKSGMFQSDYTRKTQALSQERDGFKKEMDEFKKSREEWEKNEKAKYDRYNEVLSTRPDIQRILAESVNKPPTPDAMFERAQSYTDEKSTTLEERIAAIEQQGEEARLEQERDKAFGELEQEIQGFDRQTVMDTLQTLDAGDPKSLMAMIFKASKYNPVEMQEKVEEKIAAKAGAKMVPGGGGPAPKNKGSTDPKIAREEAMKELL